MNPVPPSKVFSSSISGLIVLITSEGTLSIVISLYEIFLS